jgi:hypothetical protein
MTWPFSCTEPALRVDASRHYQMLASARSGENDYGERVFEMQRGYARYAFRLRFAVDNPAAKNTLFR